ncbi:MAG: LemA family protein [Gammaproteobacteria bacterium]
MLKLIAYTLLVLSGLALVYAILMYNRLIMLMHNVRKSWSNIDVVLKQRHDELPKLVATCKEYMRHEQTTLERVIEARSRVAAAREAHDLPALGTAEQLLRGGLGQLFALVERYPDLKANETFQHLRGRITGLENAIADRREFYNDGVNHYNVAIEQFPELVIAKGFSFKPDALLEFDGTEVADVNVTALFQS